MRSTRPTTRAIHTGAIPAASNCPRWQTSTETAPPSTAVRTVRPRRPVTFSTSPVPTMNGSPWSTSALSGTARDANPLPRIPRTARQPGPNTALSTHGQSETDLRSHHPARPHHHHYPAHRLLVRRGDRRTPQPAGAVDAVRPGHRRHAGAADTHPARVARTTDLDSRSDLSTRTGSSCVSAIRATGRGLRVPPPVA